MLARLDLHQTMLANRDWRMWGRLGKQLPPDDTSWRSWLILGGRGAGKTRAGAEWVKAQALGNWANGEAQARRIAIVGPTLEQARSVMIEGKSGLLSVHMEAERPLTVGAGGYIGGRSLEKVASATRSGKRPAFPFMRGSDRKG